MISLDFQFFNCLYLSPPTYGGGSIMPGCSIEDCMKQFFVAERLENYFCTHCWHTSAMKYLSLLNKNETDIEKLQNCSKQDTCGCRNIQSLKSLPWSNNYSHTFKQLHIARSPKILCLNLQRASINAFGESVKLQGHITFPLSLNMSRFQNGGVEIKHMEQNQQPIRYSHIFKLQNDSYPLCNVYKQGKESNLTERSTDYVETIDTELEIQEEQSHETLKSTPNGDHTYNLVSVVEHFGSTGEPCDVYWVGVSDSHVCRVSEEDVLGSRASLLFYERVLES
ncbi:unnamed protein product [Lactuca saligna]|uniref:ubiquitinyl hydrolase 1 n=1 Tax=Lactuca saligna TaxID=75948 RepID=A0AA35VZK0_LACSI|nr:unnamed protein product [Lactuca saligna]